MMGKTFHLKVTCVVALVVVIIGFGCSKGKKEMRIIEKKTDSTAAPQQQSSATAFPEKGPVSVKAFDVSPGADPSVPAEQGGAGFTGQGWQTSTTFKDYSDPKAKKGGSLT
ncbi:MAG: hypothetical protein JW795_18285, partial [Chitinivibrionales bacterium]|nr:hypothetical protein [Chitinivibrionales bacterium]